MAIAPPAAPATMQASFARTAACPCGSLKRYKHCCGKPVDDATAKALRIAETALHQAWLYRESGDADKAAGQLACLDSDRLDSLLIARVAGELYLEMHMLEPASRLLKRALDLGDGNPFTASAYADCRYLIDRLAAWQTAGCTIAATLDRINARAATRGNTDPLHVHIVCKLDTIGGTERRALNLYRSLSPRAQVTLWSTEPLMAQYRDEFPARQIGPTDAPTGGTLVLVGTYFACGNWLETNTFDRVVVCHNMAEQNASLSERLRQIEANPSRPRVDLTFPSRLFKETLGLPGQVEYSSVDLELFRRTRPMRTDRDRLTVGRHGRAHRLKFHPNDPAFFRTLIARGHQVRILGGSMIASAFEHDRGTLPDLLDVGAEPGKDFLENLDVFVYRKHPGLFETGGTAITEAMAMELPVVIFPELCGVAELIEHGRNGFLVHNEADAIDVIERLAADPALRERVGRAARATIVEVMQAQEPAVTAYYLK